MTNEYPSPEIEEEEDTQNLILETDQTLVDIPLLADNSD